MKIKIAVIVLLLFASIGVRAEWSIMTSEADSLVRVGLNAAYNTDYNLASECAIKINEKYPRNPVGYFLSSLIDWQKLWIEKNSTKYDKAFLYHIDQTIQASQAILDTDNHCLPALFFKGAALGYKGRYFVIREDFIKAIEFGKQGYDVLNDCRKIMEGGNDDINLGSGLVNFYAVVFQEKLPYLKPLLEFIAHGDKMLGKYQLQAAANNGRYANIEAKIQLMEIYYSYDRDDKEAFKIADSLHKAYPNNPYFHKMYSRLLVRLGVIDQFEKEWRQILINCISRKYGYESTIARESMYYIGMALERRQKTDDAIKYFLKCNELSEFMDKKEPSDFKIQANIHLGQIYESKGKKELAIKYYKNVLNWPDKQNSQTTAKDAIRRLLKK